MKLKCREPVIEAVSVRHIIAFFTDVTCTELLPQWVLNAFKDSIVKITSLESLSINNLFGSYEAFLDDYLVCNSNGYISVWSQVDLLNLYEPIE